MTGRCYILTFLLALSTQSFAASKGNPVKGAELFKQCAVCHSIGPTANISVGPHLNHLFGRLAASVEEFKYSAPMIEKGKEGLIWDEKSLYLFVAGPNLYVPGTTMGFKGLRREKEIYDLLSFLISYSPAYEPDSGMYVTPEMAIKTTLPDAPDDSGQAENPQFTSEYLAEREPVELGSELWAKQCRHCHGNAAYPGKAPKLRPSEYTPEFVFDRVTNGFRKMPAWKTAFNLEERMALVSYVVSKDFSP